MRLSTRAENKIAYQNADTATAASAKNSSSTVSQSPADKSEKKLCTYSLPLVGAGAGWDTGSGFRKYVDEAKRRGYTPESCAKAIGRTTQVASGAKSSGDDLDLCARATVVVGGTRRWDNKIRRRDEYVPKAKKRGLTPKKCDDLLGRTTQVAELSPLQLCRHATTNRHTYSKWNHSAKTHVSEAKRRGYTPESCAKALGRTTQVASTPKPKAAPELTTLDEAYVALKNANVRKGPGTAFEKVASLSKGDAITALGKVKDINWYLIEKAGKKLGYVYGNLIAPEASQQAAALRPATQPTKDVATKVSTPRLASTSDIHFGKYHALVIGNSDYQHLPDLKTAVADAKAVKEVLVNDYGFDAKLLLNATRDDLLEALDDYRERLQYDDNLLIYCAGHGYLDEMQNRGYWLAAASVSGRRQRREVTPDSAIDGTSSES